MQSERKQMDEFINKFDWVRCLGCLAKISRDHRTFVLTCRHTFCAKCFQKDCRILDREKRIASCIYCHKQAQFTLFSENLPTSFLNTFEPVNFTAMTRAAQFQKKHMDTSMSQMNGKLNRMQERIKQKEHGLEQQRGKTEQLKQECQTKYQQALRFYSPAQIKQMLSLPMKTLKNVNFSEMLKTPPKSSSSPSRSRIDEYSPTPLIRQVLMKNASTKTSNETSSGFGF